MVISALSLLDLCEIKMLVLCLTVFVSYLVLAWVSTGILVIVSYYSNKQIVYILKYISLIFKLFYLSLTRKKLK